MKIETLKQRLNRDRPMTSVTIRMPEDIVEDLKRVAPLLGFSGYQPLIRAYIGQGLRVDLERFESETITALIENLKRRGVSPEVIDDALNEVVHRWLGLFQRQRQLLAMQTQRSPQKEPKANGFGDQASGIPEWLEY